ncbi:MAG: PAS domain-containing sensor histidine kinase [Micromonosporaceae bacterium]|nr:PAS domain-containing sensor histidine kinase [Micromonosporaceae bacterium]
MRGGADDRVTGQGPALASVGREGSPAEAATLLDGARTSKTMVELQSLVAGLATTRGITAARLAVARQPEGDSFAALMVALPSVSPAEVVRQIGLPRWRLELRVTFGDPERYARFGPVVGEIAGAAERIMKQPCDLMARLPWTVPYTLYTTVCAKASEVVVLVDPRGGWFPLSESFASVLGYGHDQISPDSPLVLIHPNDQADAIAAFTACCAGQRVYGPVDLRARSADGRWLTFEVTARTLVTEEGDLVVVYFAGEVTAQRRATSEAELERGRLTTLAEVLSDGIMIIGGGGRIELLNSAGKRLLRVRRRGVEDPEEISALLAALGRWLVNGESDVGRLRDFLLGGPATGMELEFTDGRIVEFDLVPLDGGRDDGGRVGGGAVVQFRDVTARVAASRGLLTAGVGEAGVGVAGVGAVAAGAAVVGATAAGAEERVLAEVNARNNEFVSTVVHELRGPLSSVVAFSCLLGEPSTGELTEEQRGHLSAIDRNANRLLRLIEDLLLLSRLEARTVAVQWAPVRLADLLGAAVTEYQQAAETAGIELRWDLAAGPDLTGDGARLYQVVGNLLDNALRFTPRGGRITIRSRHEHGWWRVDVSDTGIGIPAADLPKLFGVFFRGSNAASGAGRGTSPGTSPSTAPGASPGTGLGLVVCRAIVELHGGAIQVASTEGIGTTVTMTLPGQTPSGAMPPGNSADRGE